MCLYLYSVVDWLDAVRLLKNISPGYLLLTLLICTLDQVFMALKWQLLLRSFNIYVPFFVPIAAYFGGRAVNIVVPSGVGADVYKTYYLSQYGVAATSTISSIFVERFIGILSSFAVICLLLYFSLNKLSISNRVSLSFCGLILFFTITAFVFALVKYSNWFARVKFPAFFPQKLTKALSEIGCTLSMLKSNRNRILFFYAASIFEKIFYGTAIYFSAKAIGLETINYVYLVSATPLLALLERAPISFGSIGIREGLFVVLFSPYFTSPTAPVSVALVLRLVELIIVGMSLLFWATGTPRRIDLKSMETVSKESRIKKTAESTLR